MSWGHKGSTRSCAQSHPLQTLFQRQCVSKHGQNRQAGSALQTVKHLLKVLALQERQAPIISDAARRKERELAQKEVGGNKTRYPLIRHLCLEFFEHQPLKSIYLLGFAAFFILQIEKLRTSIQTLTRSANPLGKIMDYIQVRINKEAEIK